MLTNKIAYFPGISITSRAKEIEEQFYLIDAILTIIEACKQQISANCEVEIYKWTVLCPNLMFYLTAFEFLWLRYFIARGALLSLNQARHNMYLGVKYKLFQGEELSNCNEYRQKTTWEDYGANKDSYLSILYK